MSDDRGASWSLTTPLDWNISSVLPATESVVLVGTYRKGIKRSEDGGTSWTSVGFDRNTYVDGLTQDESGRVFAAVAHSVDDEPTGVFRSDDGGVTWVPSGLAGEHAHSVSVLLAGPMYAGTESGTYRSSDGGVSWVAVAGLPSSVPLSALVVVGDVLIAGFAEPRYRAPSSGAWVSADGGDTWQRMEGLPPETAVHSLIVVGDSVLAATGDVHGGGGTGVYRSDGHTKWDLMGLEDQWLRTLVLSPNGELFVGAIESGVFARDPGGTDWSPRRSGLRNWNPMALAFDARGGLNALSLRSLLRYEGEVDGWSDLVLPNAAAAPTPFSFSALSDGTLLMPGEGGILLQGIGLGAWERKEIPGASGPVLGIHVDREDRVFATFPAHGSFVSADRGGTWTRVDAPSGTRGVSASPTGALFAFGEGVSRRGDGEAWAHTHLQGALVFSIEACEGDLYLGSAPEGVFRSRDDGRSWMPLMDSLRGTTQQPGYIAVHSLLCVPGRGLLAATFSDGVFLLMARGRWKDVTRGLATRSVGDLALASGGTVYLATPVGVYRSALADPGGDS
ncbi:MAG: hypothetical protein ACSLFK_16370 [Gemmatimonadaceae bacterium]